MYNESEVSKLADKYELKVRVFPNAIFITSKYDEWVAEINHKEYIRLKHINKSKLKPKGKFRTHQQDIFTDMKVMFECINSHDQMKKRKMHLRSWK